MYDIHLDAVSGNFWNNCGMLFFQIIYNAIISVCVDAGYGSAKGGRSYPAPGPQVLLSDSDLL